MWKYVCIISVLQCVVFKQASPYERPVSLWIRYIRRINWFRWSVKRCQWKRNETLDSFVYWVRSTGPCFLRRLVFGGRKERTPHIALHARLDDTAREIPIQIYNVNPFNPCVSWPIRPRAVTVDDVSVHRIRFGSSECIIYIVRQYSLELPVSRSRDLFGFRLTDALTTENCRTSWGINFTRGFEEWIENKIVRTQNSDSKHIKQHQRSPYCTPSRYNKTTTSAWNEISWQQISWQQMNSDYWSYEWIVVQ